MPDSVGKCPPGLEARDFGVTEEDMVEAAHAARTAVENAPLPVTISPFTFLGEFLDSAGPVIAEAAYRAGIEYARAELRSAVNGDDVLIEAVRFYADNSCDRAGFNDIGPMEQATLMGAFRAALVAALTDSEGQHE